MTFGCRNPVSTLRVLGMAFVLTCASGSFAHTAASATTVPVPSMVRGI